MKEDKLISKIKSSFEGQQHKAPDVWHDITSNIDQNIVDKKVRESFTNTTFIAPSFQDIFHLDQQPIDQTVRASYEQTKVAAPEESWNTIANHLTAHDSWFTIADKIQVFKQFKYNWMISSAAAFIMLLAPIGLSDYQLNTMSVSSNSLSTANELSSPKNTFAQQLNQHPTIDRSVNFNNNSAEENLELSSSQDFNLVELADLGTDLEVDQPINDLAFQTVEKIQQNLSHPLPLVAIQPSEQSSKNRFSLSLIAGAERSWIADNATRLAFDRNSIIHSKFSLGHYYGIGFNHTFNNQFGYEVNILKGEARNNLGTYNHGYYSIESNHLNYLKLAALATYQMTFTPKWSVDVGMGMSVAYLHSSSQYMNAEIVSDNQSYKNFSTGILGRIGPTYNWGNLSLNLSLNGQVGLNNIFAGTDVLTSELNPTNLMGIGVVSRIKYNF